MIHSIRGVGVLGAAPVARVRRKVLVHGQAIENATPEHRDDHDGAIVETAPPTSGDPTGSRPQMGPAILAALLTLHHGG